MLISHNPPQGVLGDGPTNAGHPALRAKSEAVKPKLHVFGHIHGGYGSERASWGAEGGTLLLNAALCGGGGGDGSDRKIRNRPLITVITTGPSGVAKLIT